MAAELDLLDFRRRVAELYRQARDAGADRDAWERWRAGRDELFATHPSSPIPPAQRPTFTGAPFHDHDPAAHLGALPVRPAEPVELVIGHSAAGGTVARRVGVLELPWDGAVTPVSVYWLDVYGGGVFVPLRDATNGVTTYGGGRYLLDTVKGADLGGGGGGELVVDLNFAYHPSCAHDPAWSCPLAPADERVPAEIGAGELLPAVATGDATAEVGS